MERKPHCFHQVAKRWDLAHEGWKWCVSWRYVHRVNINHFNSSQQATGFNQFEPLQSGGKDPELSLRTGFVKNFYKGLPRWLSGKESTCQAKDVGSIPGQEDPLEKDMVVYSNILVWEITGQRSLLGCCPRSHKESDTTQQLNNNNKNGKKKKKIGHLQIGVTTKRRQVSVILRRTEFFLNIKRSLWPM